jgi:hypothetical protein
MFNKDSMLSGILLGLVVPAMAWFIFNVLYKGVVLLHKPAIPYLVALGINLFIIRICFKKNLDDTGRGIMATTFVCVILLLVFKIRLT